MITNEISIGHRTTFRINFNLIKKNGSEMCQIWLTSTINGERARVYTGQRIRKEHWNMPEDRSEGERAIVDNRFGPVVVADCIQINKELDKIKDYCKAYARAVDRYDNPIPFSKERFEQYLNKCIRGVEVKDNSTPSGFIKNFIEAKRKQTNDKTGLLLKDGSIYNHENAFNSLKEFCFEQKKNLVWDLFDGNFKDDFYGWCLKKGYAPNTITTGRFSKMKQWMRAAENEWLLNSKAYKEWPTTKYDSDSIALTEDEIERIFRIDFNDPIIKKQIDSKSNIEISRDLFVVACWTGLRFGDLSDLSNAVIDGELIRVPTSKTHELIPIPIHKFVAEIIKKYDGGLPKGIDKSHSINHIRKCGELAGVNKETVIRKIRGGKEIIEKKPKFHFIGNHTGRRSFATNQYLRGIPTITIMAITGHKTETSFLTYIKIAKEEHAKRWLRRGKSINNRHVANRHL